MILGYIESYPAPIEYEILETGMLNIYTYSLFATVLYMGTSIGSLIAGPISEWLGLKTCLIIFSQMGSGDTRLYVISAGI